LRIANDDSANRRGCHVRKNGSTDNDTTYIKVRPAGHIYAVVGVDANRIFEAWLETANIKIYLVGYTDSAVTLFTDPYDVSLNVTGAWTDIDVSSYVPSGATGVILRIRNASANSGCLGNVRKNGSIDNDITNCRLVIEGHYWALIGVDASRIFEGYISDLAVDFYLYGYTMSPVTFFDNEKDESLTVTGSWTDIDATGDTEAAADGIILRIVNTDSGTVAFKGAIRKNGSTNNDTTNSTIRPNGCIWGLCGLDSENIYEGYIDNVAVDFKAIGYTKPGVTYVNVSDAGTGDDVPSLEAQLVVPESGAGSDILQSIGLTVTDLGVGSEMVVLSVSVPIYELGSSVELIDLLSQIQILDSGTGSESVTAGPPTAIKTKIFVIFGGLAIQLTGD